VEYAFQQRQTPFWAVHSILQGSFRRAFDLFIIATLAFVRYYVSMNLGIARTPESGGGAGHKVQTIQIREYWYTGCSNIFRSFAAVPDWLNEYSKATIPPC
jgi:hypothetical protein